MVTLVLVMFAAAGNANWEAQAIPHCENVFRLTDSVYSGGEPEGEAGLKALAARGIKTVVSVDGARPDAETAQRYGMRYIHLPIGYDGFSRERALQFGRVLTDAAGPVYFHCHHGKHRGPAAVAAGMEAARLWTPATANAFLQAAGTSKKYAGLYAVINEFVAPSDEEFAAVDADFPAVAQLPPYQENMAVIDRRYDNLELAQEAGWKQPPDHPDIAPPHEALQLKEIFTELIRLEVDADRSEHYRQLMRDALTGATDLEQALRSGNGESATAAFQALGRACAGCHDAYRN